MRHICLIVNNAAGSFKVSHYKLLCLTNIRLYFSTCKAKLRDFDICMVCQRQEENVFSLNILLTIQKNIVCKKKKIEKFCKNLKIFVF